MKKFSWEARLACLLIAISICVYAIKFLFFGDNGESNTMSYIFNSLGFLPINVLILTLIINRLLTLRSKREQQEKNPHGHRPLFLRDGRHTAAKDGSVG